VIVNAYKEQEVNGKKRYYLALKPQIAPVKIAVFPLQKDVKLVNKAQKIYQDLKNDLVAEFDSSGNIGQMYRRQDEVGTPFCATVDYQSLEDDMVTLRDRDSMQQERIKISDLKKYLELKLKV